MKRLTRSFRSFFRRCSRRLIRASRRPKSRVLLILLAIATGLILTAAVIFVLKANSPDITATSSDPLDISVENIKGEDTAVSSTTEGTSGSVASPETKVESTSDTTVLSYKENAQKGYLNRCVFLGDSRTVAMVNYGFINDDAALAQIGISHPSFKSNTFINNAGKEYTLKSYLASHQVPVIYIALGVNGINDASEEHYESTFIDLIDTVMNGAPNSNIVLMSIGPVNDNGAYKKTVQNSWINKYNDFLLETARDKHIFYLNVSEVLTGPDGQVKPEYNGGDGLHYSRSGCEEILNYIVDHPVPGIPDDGEYVVHYIKPNPRNTKVTMDDGSGIDEEKLQELMNMMMEETPAPGNEQSAQPGETPPASEEEQHTEESSSDISEEEAQRRAEEEAQRKAEEEAEQAAREEEQRKQEEEQSEQRSEEETEHKTEEGSEQSSEEDPRKSFEEFLKEREEQHDSEEEGGEE